MRRQPNRAVRNAQARARRHGLRLSKRANTFTLRDSDGRYSSHMPQGKPDARFAVQFTAEPLLLGPFTSSAAFKASGIRPAPAAPAALNQPF